MAALGELLAQAPLLRVWAAATLRHAMFRTWWTPDGPPRVKACTIAPVGDS